MTTIRAAGVLFVTPDKRALFLQRSGEGDHAGEWCLPGGKVEEGETPAEAARRECREEIGSYPKGGELLLLTRTRSFVSDVNAIQLPPGSQVAVPAATTSTLGAAAPLVPSVEADTVVDFSNFYREVDAPFDVVLDKEHTAFVWAPLASPPQPLHPGVATAVARLTMNELDIAEAIREGLLVSGQRYHGMYLVAMRVTGTGVAYRRGRKEYVLRRPELYLNERFLRRCNGLPVIMEHTSKGNLASEEYAERNCGNVFLPYILGDEVWAIVKIYDAATIKMLEEGQLSTSPSVVFRDPSTTNTRLKLDDGSVILVEGDPDLVDHLAICPKGVWDKGGEPRGIAFETYGDSDMTEEEKKAAEIADKAKKDADEKMAFEKAEKDKKDAEEQAKKDADAGEKLDKVLACMDSLTRRMDSWDEKAEKDRKDAEEKARKDGDEAQLAKDKKDAEEKAEKDRKDAEDKAKKDEEERVKKDAETAQAIKTLADAFPKPMSDEDLNAIADAQQLYDGVHSLFGKSAPRPLAGESLLQYRRRNAVTLKTHSKAYKDVDLSAIPDDDNGRLLFGNIEQAIIHDAQEAGRNPVDIPADTLRPHVTQDETGRRVTKFQGRAGAWMSGFSSNRRRLAGIRNS